MDRWTTQRVWTLSMVMCMKGHNGASPCCMCSIHSICIPDSSNPIHYVPLDHSHHPDIEALPHDHVSTYDPAHLPLRTHNESLAQARNVQFAPSEAKSEHRARKYGIKVVPLLHVLPSLSFLDSCPYKFMHLLWENVVKNLMMLWTRQYKGLNAGCKEYELHPNVWDAISEASAHSGNMIPGVSGPRPPNVASDKMLWTADTRSF